MSLLKRILTDAEDKAPPVTLTSDRVLARNTLWNLLGQGLPLLVGLASIPLLISGLGTERFGILTLAWMIIGYFSLFDLGLSRALTKLVAERLGSGDADEIPTLIWTALAMMALLGVIGMLVVAGLSHWLVFGVLNVSNVLQPETLKAILLLALSIPLVVSTSGLRGILEAYQRFGQINAIRIPMGVFTFVGPLAVLPFSKSLHAVVAVLMAGRVVAWLAHLLLCLRLMPALRRGMRVRRRVMRPLISFGGWMTLSNLVGPLMVNLDRFLIGAVISMTSVAYYTAPYEVVTKLWIGPVALVGVLFPAFAASFTQDRAYTLRLFDRGINYILLFMFPLTLIIMTLAHEGLELWLGAEFANNSEIVLQWLAAGVFVNSLARVPFVLIQGAGRPDVVAKTHLAELPLYLLALWWLLGSYGIEGAAVAWTLRVTADTLIFFFTTWRLLPEAASVIRRSSGNILLAFGAFVAGTAISDGFFKALFLCVVLSVYGVWAWSLLFGTGERQLLKRLLRLWS